MPLRDPIQHTAEQMRAYQAIGQRFLGEKLLRIARFLSARGGAGA